MPQKTSWEYFPLPCQQNCFVTPQSFFWHQTFLKKCQYLQESCFKHILFGKGKALWSLCDNFEKLSDYFWTSNHHCLTHFQDKETCSSWEPSVVSRVNWTLTNVHKISISNNSNWKIIDHLKFDESSKLKLWRKYASKY